MIEKNRVTNTLMRALVAIVVVYVEEIMQQYSEPINKSIDESIN